MCDGFEGPRRAQVRGGRGGRSLSINRRGDDRPGLRLASIDRGAMLQDSGALHRQQAGRTGCVADLIVWRMRGGS
jgi:hypothetical protein